MAHWFGCRPSVSSDRFEIPPRFWRHQPETADRCDSFVTFGLSLQRVGVKRWREGSQPLRWTATGLLEAEKKFRRIKGYQEILLLKERLNPSGIQQKEVRA